MPKPDSVCTSDFIASPNHEPRAGGDVDMLVLHYTGMSSGDAAKARLCDPAAKVSSHYLVEEDGTVIQLVEESRRAWHAGVAFWAGATDINSRSIGIEIVNGGHDFGLPDFPAQQIEAVIRLCRDVQSRWPIPQSRVLAHSDIAPTRKRDPGEKFPWSMLHEAGVGLWVSPVRTVAGGALRFGDGGNAVTKLQASLIEFGYGLEMSDIFDETTRDVVIAFQRHFRPLCVDGVADASTTMTLGHLLKMKQTTES